MEWDGMGVGDAVIIPPVFSFSLGMVFFWRFEPWLWVLVLRRRCSESACAKALLRSDELDF